jgi:hypothetical protein
MKNGALILNKKLPEEITMLNKIIPAEMILFDYRIDSPGVYIIADSNNNILYIGEAKNIYKRLSRKDHPIYNKKISKFRLDDYQVFSIIYHNDSLRWRAETFLIAAMDPIYNDIKYLYGCTKKRKR